MSASPSTARDDLSEQTQRTPSFVEAAASSKTVYFERLREMAQTPTPLADIMADPKWMRALTARPKSRSSKHSSKSSHRTGEGYDPSTLLNAVFNAEERQVNELKMALRSTGDRLEYEMQRAEAAEGRAVFVEERLRDYGQRIANFVTTQHEQDLVVARLTEEGKRFRLMMENLQTNIDHANRTIEDLKRKKRHSESEIRDLHESLREYEQVLNQERLKAIGRQQERYVNGVVEGREEGWNTAKRVEREKIKKVYLQGFEAGRIAGHEEARAYEGPYVDDQGSTRTGRRTDEVSANGNGSISHVP